MARMGAGRHAPAPAGDAHAGAARGGTGARHRGISGARAAPGRCGAPHVRALPAAALRTLSPWGARREPALGVARASSAPEARGRAATEGLARAGLFAPARALEASASPHRSHRKATGRMSAPIRQLDDLLIRE